MGERNLARLIAAYAVLGTKGIARDRIAVDERGVPRVDGNPAADNMRLRITMLGMILLDCVGYEHSEPDVIDKFRANPIYRCDFRWLQKYLGNGRISPVLAEFLEARS